MYKQDQTRCGNYDDYDCINSTSSSRNSETSKEWAHLGAILLSFVAREVKVSYSYRVHVILLRFVLSIGVAFKDNPLTVIKTINHD